MNAIPTVPLVYSYLRFSTADQLKGSSLDRQQEGFDGWITDQKASGRTIQAASVNYRDLGKSGFSGAHMSGAFGAFLDAVQSSVIPRGSILLIEDFDRMSRQTPIDAFGHFTKLVNAGITIVTLSTGREYSREMLIREHDAALPVLGEMTRAHSESARKSKLIAGSYAKRRANLDKRPLTTRCPGWLIYDPSKKGFGLIPERVTILREIFEMSAAGHGMEGIAKRLNARSEPLFTKPRADGEVPVGTAMHWTTAYISKMLNWRAVLGEFQPCRVTRTPTGAKKSVPIGEPVPDYYPQAIGFDLWEKVRISLRSRASHGETRKTGQTRLFGVGGGKGQTMANLFQHMAVCSACGAPMNLQQSDRGVGYQYFRCSRRKLSTLSCDRSEYISYTAIERAILQGATGLIAYMAANTPKDADDAIQALEAEIAGHHQAIDAANRKIIRTMDILGDDDPAGRAVIDKTKIEREASQQALRTANDRLASLRVQSPPNDYAKLITDHLDAMQHSDIEIRRDARTKVATTLRQIIKGMYVDTKAKTVMLYLGNALTEYLVLNRGKLVGYAIRENQNQIHIRDADMQERATVTIPVDMLDANHPENEADDVMNLWVADTVKAVTKLPLN